MRRPEISTIIFDLGGVFVDLHFQSAVEAFSSMYDVESKKVWSLFRDASCFVDYEKGRMDSSAFHACVAGVLNLSLSFDEFQAWWVGIFTIRADTPILLPLLKQKYKLVMLSNTNAMHADFIRDQYPIFPHFQRLFFSHEIGLRKPDPAAFQAVLDGAGVQAGECVFIDDSAVNVEAARTMGIHGYVFKSDGRLHAGSGRETSIKDEFLNGAMR